MRIIQILFKHGDPMVCGKAVMKMLGVGCGGVRSPLRSLDDVGCEALREDLAEVGFFGFCSKAAESVPTLSKDSA